MKIAVCDVDSKAVEIFGRYAAAVIEYAFTYEFYQNPEEMLAAYAGQEQGPDMYVFDFIRDVDAAYYFMAFAVVLFRAVMVDILPH